MTKSVFQSQLEDEAAFDALLGAAESVLRETPSVDADADADLERARSRLRKGRTTLEQPDTSEAIVMLHGYPSLLIREGDYERPANPEWRRRLDPHRARIRHVIANTGRVDLVGHRDYQWVGTAWRVDETTFVTNRHVAEIFHDARRGPSRILDRVEARIDLAEEHESDTVLEHLVRAIRHIEPKTDRNVDMALLTIDRDAADLVGDPVELTTDLDGTEIIGVVGYPASDHRNPQGAMHRIFGTAFNVKRLAPGRIMDRSHDGRVFTHNCTTLGGNSGSAVFDVESGRAIGLHFAGNALTQNYAVKGSEIARVLGEQGIRVAVDGRRRSGAKTDTNGAGESTLDGRDGYDPQFIGTGGLAVPMPRLNGVQARRLARADSGEAALHYRHFSVAMNGARRLAYVAAVNVDGKSLSRPRRIKSFRLDPRLAKGRQAGEALYDDNDLDRGHLVRRLDPCWGGHEIADEANRDSFYFPNIAPQHKDLNQRIWREIEDHVLDTTDEHDARISVFVGCVFGDADPVHAPTGIPVPLGFWKVIASCGRVRRGRAAVRELQAQAFVLWQDHLVGQDDLELVFGREHSTHQVTVDELGRITGLDFGPLVAADTFALPPALRERQAREAVTNRSVVASEASTLPLRSLEDIVLGPNVRQ